MGRSWQYIAGFATAVCLVCSVIVAGSAVALKSKQEDNKVLDRQKKVLIVSGLMAENARLSAKEIQELFKANVKARVVDLSTGKFDPKTDAATYDQRKATKDGALSRKTESDLAKKAGIKRVALKATVYEVVDGKNVEMLILPIEGKGLWSTLYGYVALAKDTNTIRGITFYEHGETPGLGGEVDNPKWKALWPGRKVFGEDGKAKIQVIKGIAPPPAVAPYKVDGLSGATITANGVTFLLRFWMSDNAFGKFLKNYRKGGATS